jgi:hypothetical protein
MNAIQSILQSYPSRWALASAGVCGLAAAEMAVRALGTMAKATQENLTDGEKDALSKNLGGAVFYGMCAANIVPYAAVVGGIICVGYGIFTGENKDTYYLFRGIYEGVATLHKRIIAPLWNRAIFPILEAIAKVVKAILDLVPLPQNSAWLGVGVLAAVAIVYNRGVLLNLLSKSQV